MALLVGLSDFLGAAAAGLAASFTVTLGLETTGVAAGVFWRVCLEGAVAGAGMNFLVSTLLGDDFLGLAGSATLEGDLDITGAADFDLEDLMALGDSSGLAGVNFSGDLAFLVDLPRPSTTAGAGLV